MHKLLERTKRVIEELSNTFSLGTQIEVGTDDGGETLEIDGWITVGIEMHKTDVGPWKGHDVPQVVIYAASITPATRWEPEDVDVNIVLSTPSFATAGRHVVNMIIENAINGVIESIVYGFDEEDQPNREDV